MLGFAVEGWAGWGKGGECTDHYEPFRFLDAVGVWLWISQRFPFGVFGRFDFVGGAVADEDGLAAPFDDDLFPRARGNQYHGIAVVTNPGTRRCIRSCPRVWQPGQSRPLLARARPRRRPC